MFDTSEACKNCLESQESLFKDLPREDKDLLARNHTARIVRRGELVYREGDKPNGIICLASGKVKVFMEGIAGREQILRLVKPMGLLGYRSFFAEENYHATAMAIEDSVVCLFPREDVLNVLKSRSELSLKLLKVMAGELGVSNSRMVNLTQKHIRGRLAESILYLLATCGLEEDGKTIRVYLSRDDLASLSNMTSSNAIRTLSQFVSEGIISTDGRKLRVINKGRLEHISEMG